MEQSSSDFSAAKRGHLDDQFELSGSLLDHLRVHLRVVKRDGQLETFEPRKIARAISCAAYDGTLSDFNTSESLASGVALYLGRFNATDTVSTDEIHAAVERLLIEMGYSTVAAALSRHRDRKRRLADIARGEVRRFTPDFGSENADEDTTGITVLNSDDTISRWQRERVVKALHQETELDRETANQVAEVVESELAKLNLKTVTSGLIRELVGAVLLSSGETDHGARHQRVGIPMYDAERTILGADAAEISRRSNPDSTNEALAGRLKREFALARVFSQDIAEAHRWGDIHIHGLDSIDRVLAFVISPDWIKLYGVPGAAASRRSPVRARRADTLVAQLAGASTALRHYATEALRWDALNWSFAPFVENCGTAELKDLARVLLFEFAYRHMTDPNMFPLTIDLAWSLPPHMQNVAPLGPRDEAVQSDYAAYASPARRFALAILDVHREVSADQNNLQLPLMHVSMGPDCFLDRGFNAFLMRVSELANLNPVAITFQRDAFLIGESDNLAAPREVVAHRVSLNLPRAAYRSRNADEFLRECERVFDVAVAAHVQKRAFLARLVRAGDEGPLAAIARRHDNVPWFQPERAVYEIAVAGVNEAMSHLAASGAESALFERLRAVCAQWSESEAMELRVSSTVSTHARERMAEADLRYYYLPAEAALRDAIATGRIRYSDPSEATQLDRLLVRTRAGNAFHPATAIPVKMPDLVKEASPETIAHTIREIFAHSTIPAIRF